MRKQRKDRNHSHHQLILAACSLLAAIETAPSTVSADTIQLLDVPPVWQAQHPFGFPVPIGAIIPGYFAGNYDVVNGYPVGRFQQFTNSSATGINDAGLVAVLLSAPLVQPYPRGATLLTYLWNVNSGLPFWNTSIWNTNTQFLVIHQSFSPSNNAFEAAEFGDNLWEYNVALNVEHSGSVLAGSTLPLGGGYKPSSFVFLYSIDNPGTNSGQRSNAAPSFGDNYLTSPIAANSANTRVGIAQRSAPGPIGPSVAWIGSNTSNNIFPASGGFGRSKFDAINEHAIAVGWGEYQLDHFQAAASLNGQLSLLGTLPDDTDSFASAINESGTIVGISGQDPYSGTAFIYKNHAMTSLGTLPGAADSSPNAINDAGTVVGESGGHAFLWANGTMIDLNSQLSPGSPWILTSANSINNYGQIVGDGLYNGLQRGFLFDLPASGNVALPINPTAGILDINGTTRLGAGLFSAAPGGTITNSNALPVLLRLSNTASQSFPGAITGNITLVKDGPAAQSLSGTNTYTGSTIVNAGKLSTSPAALPANTAIIVNGGELELASIPQPAAYQAAVLTMWAGHVAITGNANTPFVLQTVPYLAGNASLDLRDATLIIHSWNKTADIATLAQLLHAGHYNGLGGSWTGNGISSSTVALDNFDANAHATTLVLVDNIDLHLTSFNGQPVDDNTLIITRALQGDADLSGTVDLLDFNTWFNNVGTTTFSSANGDLNTDGIVDLLDFNLWFTHVGFTAPGLPLAPIPEPTSLILFTLGATLLLAKRRKF